MSSEPKVVDSPTGGSTSISRTTLKRMELTGRYSRRSSAPNHHERQKTGTLHRTALYYGEDDGRYIIVASKGGSPAHPAWFLNLEANPDVELQVGPEIFPAHARVARAMSEPASGR